MYYTHSGYQTSIFGKNCAYYIRIFTVAAHLKQQHSPFSVRFATYRFITTVPCEPDDVKGAPAALSALADMTLAGSTDDEAVLISNVNKTTQKKTNRHDQYTRHVNDIPTTVLLNAAKSKQNSSSASHQT